MEAFHSRLRHSALQMMRKELNQLNDETSGTKNIRAQITARVISEDHCINKLIRFVDLDVTIFQKFSTSVFDKALLSLWTEKYFSSEANAKVLEMGKLLQSELEEVFKENTWIDDKTRERAIKKLHTLTLNVGFPAEILDEEKMKSYHDQFLTAEMDPNAFIENQVCCV